MLTYNIGFYEEMTKITFNYHQTSSNRHFNCSSTDLRFCCLHRLMAGFLMTRLI